MNKCLIGTLALMMAGCMFLTGCNLTNEQIQVISQNAGLGAAITWIAYDNPDTNAVDFVKEVLDIVSENAICIQTGVTYTATVYPEIEEFVTGEYGIPDQYQPLVLAGGLAVLNGIDLLFALHPEWKTQQDLAIDIVMSFTMGAYQGLSLSEKDPLIIQAKALSTSRAKIYNK